MNSMPHILSTTLNPCVQTIEKNMATHITDKMLLTKKKALTADSDWRMPKWENPYTSNPTHNRPSSTARAALRCSRFRMLTLDLIKTTMHPSKASDRQLLSWTV